MTEARQTLEQWGVSPGAFSMEETLEELNPRCILIKDCYTWDEVKEILTLNQDRHPNDKIWIGYDFRRGCHQVGREAI